MNREDKIAKIYEMIADKTLSFGCLMKSYYNGKIQRLGYAMQVKYIIGLDDYCDEEDLLDSREIIGHPVMIGDVLDWNEKIEMTNIRYENCEIEYVESEILWERKNKRKAIEDQSDECVDFIYSLLGDD